MGWLEDQQEKTRLAREKADRSRESVIRFDLGSGGRIPSGSNFMSLMKNLTGSDKFPDDKFEREFLVELDNTPLDVKSVYALLKTYGKKGTSSSRFSGINQDSVISHLGKVISRYRPEVAKILQDKFHEEGG